MCGQNAIQDKDAAKLFKSDVPDDRIIQACVQLKNQNKSVKLCTLDKMLIVKILTSKSEFKIDIFKCDKFIGSESASKKRSAPPIVMRTMDHPEPMDIGKP